MHTTSHAEQQYMAAGAVAGLVSHVLNARIGRKWCMVIAGFWFTVGAAINAGARDLAMLYIGRVLLGFGVGFANQSVSLSSISLADAAFAAASVVAVFADHVLLWHTQSTFCHLL